MTALKVPVDFRALVEEGTVFEVQQNQDPNLTDEENDLQTMKEYEEAIQKFSNLNCIGEFDDEDTYNDQEPFDNIASKMTNLTECGGIKKRVLREGYGEYPESNALVKVNYNAYLEYTAEPFDSTYARKKPHSFHLDSGEVLPGLDLAVESMKINEKSQFLIAPQYAYGKVGCLQRVPPNSTVLFEIELLDIIESGAAENFQNLPPEKKKEFKEVYKYCLSLCAKGKDSFGRNLKAAIREYNTAVHALEFAQLETYEDQEKQQELLLKLYSNLLICYCKDEQPGKGCSNFNKIDAMCKGSQLKVSAKVYYNNAKCLRMLGDFDTAKNRLRRAYNLEPRNPDILNEFKRIDDEQKKYVQAQKKLSKAFVSNTK